LLGLGSGLWIDSGVGGYKLKPDIKLNRISVETLEISIPNTNPNLNTNPDPTLTLQVLEFAIEQQEKNADSRTAIQQQFLLNKLQHRGRSGGSSSSSSSSSNSSSNRGNSNSSGSMPSVDTTLWLSQLFRLIADS
jgi:hypothetical protein